MKRLVVLLILLAPFLSQAQFYLADQNGVSLLNDTVPICESENYYFLKVQSGSGIQGPLIWTSSSPIVITNTNIQGWGSAEVQISSNIQSITLASISVEDSTNQKDTTLYIRLIPDTLVSSGITDTSITPCSTPFLLSKGTPNTGSYFWNRQGFGNSIDSIKPSSLSYGNNSLYYTFRDHYGCLNSDSSIIHVGAQLSSELYGFVIYGSQNDTITPLIFNGVPTYSICSSASTPTFGIQFTGSLFDFSSYSIDWGDGSQTTGNVSSTPVNHQFNAPSLYQIVLQLTDSNNCTSVDTVAFYYGTSQSLGLGTPGNTSTCFESDIDSIYYDFQVLYWELDPTGISYNFSSNDGSATLSASSPLVENGVSNYPFLIYDSITGSLFYRHWFTSSSCGYFTDLAGITYNNVFSVSAIKSAPCNGSQSAVEVGPILVSQSPNPTLQSDSVICINDTALISANSGTGTSIISSGNNFICSNNEGGVWFIEDDQGNFLNPSSSTYSLAYGSSLGDTNYSASYPGLWTYGSGSLSIIFHQTGYFKVTKLTGLVNIGSNVFCQTDVTSNWLCVDSITQIGLLSSLPDTICSFTDYFAEFDSANSLCGDSLKYRVTILDESQTDSLYFSGTSRSPKFSVQSSGSGKQIIWYQAISPCGIWEVMDSIYVPNNPKIQFLKDTVTLCSDSLFISIGANEFSFNQAYDPLLYDTVVCLVSSPQNWTQVSINSLGLPVIQFNSQGAYTIQLIFQGECRTDSAAITLNFGSLPDAYFLLDTTLICTSTIITVDSIVDSNYAHVWIIEYGNLSVSQTLAYPDFDTLSTDGIDSLKVTHIVTNEFSCKDSLSQLILLPERLFANFSINDSLCSGQQLGLINSSSGNVVHHSWELSMLMGDSIMISLSNNNDSLPTINMSGFTLPVPSQQYLISLTVYDKDSCSSIRLDTLNVFPKPNSAVFDLTNDTICNRGGLFIDSIVDSGGNHDWYLLNSGGSTIMTYPDTILSKIELDNLVTSVYTLVHKVSVGDRPLCDSVYSATFFITPEIDFSVSTPITNCATDTIEIFTDSLSDPNLDWVWTIEDSIYSTSTIIRLNMEPGIYSYSVSGSDEFNCSHVLEDSLHVFATPDVRIISNGPCGFDTLCRLDSTLYVIEWDSISNSGSSYFSSWDWNGDSVFDSQSDSASIRYNATGAESLWIEWSNEFGCSKDTLFNLYVQKDLFVDIKFNSLINCGDYTPIITDSIYGTIDSGYYQVFPKYLDTSSIIITKGFGDTTVFPKLSAAIENDTSYVISLTVWNCCEKVVAYDTITLSPLPKATLFAIQDTGCSPFNCTFQPDGFLYGGIDSAYINFGDGQGSKLSKVGIPIGSQFDSIWQPISHSYAYQGATDTTYIAELFASNRCGDTSSTIPITVQRGSVLSSFSPTKTSGCAPLTVDFLNLSYNYKSLGWCFDFDTVLNVCDTNTVAIENPSWTFNEPGLYTVALFVNANCGADTSFMTIEVFPSPIVSFVSPLNYCGNDTISFLNTSSFQNGGILGYLWSFGDGDSSIIINPTHSYSYSNNYKIILTAYGDNGCKGIDSSEIEVLPTPQVEFQANSVCLGDTVFFTNSSSIPIGQIVGYKWEFGDSNTSNAVAPYHVYNQPGVYEIVLEATSNSGCISRYRQFVTVSQLPSPDFNWTLVSNDSCSLPQTYQFFNTSSGGVGLLWDFDYQNPGVLISTLNNPQFTFTSQGDYHIMLYVENQNGCWDTISQELNISEGIDAQINSSQREGCIPFDVSFYNISVSPFNDSIKSIEYVFGDGVRKVVNSPPFNIIHTYNNPGSFKAYALVTSTSGCTYFSSGLNVLVHDLPYPDFSYINYNNLQLGLINNSVPLDSNFIYQWSLSNGQLSYDFEPNFQLPQLSNNYDSIRVCLLVESIQSCTNSLCKNLWIWESSLYVPNAFAPDLNYVGEDNMFLPKGHNLDIYELWIYDKWGNLVYYSDKIESLYNSPLEGWNGLFMGTGEPMPLGVYSWRINAIFLDNKRWLGQENSFGEILTYGTLTLLR